MLDAAWVRRAAAAIIPLFAASIPVMDATLTEAGLRPGQKKRLRRHFPRYSPLMAAPPAPPVGWMIAVMLQSEDEPAPVRRYFAVGRTDRSRAEWAAVDAAVAL